MTTYHEDEAARIKIDNILIEIAAIECTLGKDSTEEEKKAAKDKQRKLHRDIRNIDSEFCDIIDGNEEQKRSPVVLDFIKKTFSGDNIKKTLDKGFAEWVKKVLHLNKADDEK
jgi:hypothetical protein